jgi:hypothetical protein
MTLLGARAGTAKWNPPSARTAASPGALSAASPEVADWWRSILVRPRPSIGRPWEGSPGRPTAGSPGSWCSYTHGGFALAIDPTDPNTLYDAGQPGVLKSRSRSTAWSRLRRAPRPRGRRPRRPTPAESAPIPAPWYVGTSVQDLRAHHFVQTFASLVGDPAAQPVSVALDLARSIQYTGGGCCSPSRRVGTAPETLARRRRWE